MTVAFAASAHAAFPGQNGKIAFSDLEEQGPPPPTTWEALFTVNPDGTGLTNLTPGGPPSNFEPEWSADGTKIVFRSDRSADDTGYDIWFMNADGSGIQRVTSTFASDFSPSWSPDGTKIAFTANLVGNSEIYVINVDGSGLQNVTNNTENQEGNPQWSPDGSKILYSSRTTNFSPNIPHIWVMNADGSNQTEITAGSGEGGADWSPDGSKISYVRSGCSPVCRQHLYVANPDGTGEQEVVSTPARSFGGPPAWSPDGTKFAFTELRSIWTINVDGTGQVQITPDANTTTDPDWQPTFGTGYPRPKSASPVRASLVPAYAQCTAGNRTHGPPLAFGSCSPPAQTSPYATVGTPDANGAAAAMSGMVRVKVNLGAPGPPHDTQAFAFLDVTDVRCTPLSTTCGAANAAGGADYTGELHIRLGLRITDRDSATPPAEFGADPATMTDYTFELPMFSACAATASTSIGSTCSVNINLAAVIPGSVPEGKRAIWEIDELRVFDGGSDGDAGTTGDNELFLKQGVFIP